MGPHLSESNLRSQAPDQVRVVALDPGVRNFITWFSEDGCGKLGQEDFGRIQRLCKHQDNLLPRAAQAPSKRQRNMRRAAERMTVRIQNLINELHHKTAGSWSTTSTLYCCLTSKHQGWSPGASGGSGQRPSATC